MTRNKEYRAAMDKFNNIISFDQMEPELRADLTEVYDMLADFAFTYLREQ